MINPNILVPAFILVLVFILIALYLRVRKRALSNDQDGYDWGSEIIAEVRQAVMRTLYHHPRVTPIIVEMLTGETFETPPPLPTDKERALAVEKVEKMVNRYYDSLGDAYSAILGENLEQN